jgi:hypothetical protein
MPARAEIDKMMTDAGLQDVHFSKREPDWCALGVRRATN